MNKRVQMRVSRLFYMLGAKEHGGNRHLHNQPDINPCVAKGVGWRRTIQGARNHRSSVYPVNIVISTILNAAQQYDPVGATTAKCSSFCCNLEPAIEMSLDVLQAVVWYTLQVAPHAHYRLSTSPPNVGVEESESQRQKSRLHCSAVRNRP